MSRENPKTTVDEEKVNKAASIMLGMVMYFNKGQKSTTLLADVQKLGFTAKESYEALQILTAANIVETQIRGCCSKKLAISISEHAIHTPLPSLFKEMKRAAPTTLVDEASDYLRENGVDIAKSAVGLIATIVR